MTESAIAPVVRQAELVDVGAIAAAHIRSWQAGYAHVISGDFLRSLDLELDQRLLRWETIILGAGADSHFVLVGELGGEVVGFLTGGPCRDTGQEGSFGEIHGCYVDPDHWREGVGSALMAVGVDLLTQAGYDEAVLWVLTDNPRARGFYEHHGWRADGSQKTYEVGGEPYPEVRYRRSLS
ncbi:MAG: GNAT family N-acetyltransferase [Acidimicrobiales bacterium]|jgi:ribosomal protein S18 acetylase RimI-like enzyme